MSVEKDLLILCQRVNSLEINSEDYNRRLNKLEGDEQVERCAADVLDRAAADYHDYAIDWYIKQYQNMCKNYGEAKIELADKQKVLEMVMDQRDRADRQIYNQKNMIKNFENVNCDLEKSNQILRGKIKNHEDRILELEKEVEYHKVFSGSAKIKDLEDDYQEQQNLIKLFEAANVDMARKIKDLEHKNKFISDLNNVYRKMLLKDE